MARCLTFILEGVEPQASKDQEHDGECEGEIESLSVDLKEAEAMENVQAEKKRLSTFQLKSPRMRVLSVLVLIKDKKSDNSMRQEELQWSKGQGKAGGHWGMGAHRKKENND